MADMVLPSKRPIVHETRHRCTIERTEPGPPRNCSDSSLALCAFPTNSLVIGRGPVNIPSIAYLLQLAQV